MCVNERKKTKNVAYKRVKTRTKNCAVTNTRKSKKSKHINEPQSLQIIHTPSSTNKSDAKKEYNEHFKKPTSIQLIHCAFTILITFCFSSFQLHKEQACRQPAMLIGQRTLWPTTDDVGIVKGGEYLFSSSSHIYTPKKHPTLGFSGLLFITLQKEPH